MREKVNETLSKIAGGVAQLYRKSRGRDYSKLNESCLANDIQSVNWHDFLSTNNPSSSTLFDIFYTKLSVIMDKHIPVKQLSKRELKIQSKPWISTAIRKSIKVKNEFYKKYLKTKSPYYHSKFKFYRNKLNHLLRISKRNYYSDYLKKIQIMVSSFGKV